MIFGLNSHVRPMSWRTGSPLALQRRICPRFGRLRPMTFFVRLTTAVEEHLKARGAMYYPGIGAARSVREKPRPEPAAPDTNSSFLKAAIAAAP